MAERTYVIGCPVVITVDDYGRVTLEIDFGDVDVAELDGSVIDDAQVSADWERIRPAIERNGSRQFRVVPA